MSEIHSFNCELAAEYGLPESVLIQHFIHWISINKRLGRNLHNGKTWTYMTLEEIAACYSYFSRDQINRLITKLCKMKVLIKGNFNKNAYDRTVWYAFVDEEKFLKLNFCSDKPKVDEKPEIHLEKSQKPHLAKSPNEFAEIATPIPDPIPDTKRKTKGGSAAPILKGACGALRLSFKKDTERETKGGSAAPVLDEQPRQGSAEDRSSSLKKEKDLLVSEIKKECKTITDRTLKHWIKDYGLKSMRKTLLLLRSEKKIRNKEAWMEAMMKTGTTDVIEEKRVEMEKRANNQTINRKVLEKLMGLYPGVPVEIGRDYFEFKGLYKDFSLYTEPAQFKHVSEAAFAREAKKVKPIESDYEQFS